MVVVIVTAVLKVASWNSRNLLICMFGGGNCVVGSGSCAIFLGMVLFLITNTTTSTSTIITTTTTIAISFIATFTTQHKLNYGTSGNCGVSGIGLVVMVMVVVMVKYWW